MNLVLQRERSSHGFTSGELSIDEDFECYTCEDEVLEIPGMPVAAWKVPGVTAIPAGRYRVMVTMSHRFKRELPLVCDVPGFTGIRIHPGNTEADTEGCILPGVYNTTAGVAESRKAFAALFDKIQDAIQDGEEVWLQILNPVAVIS